jgi:hypothetical protein
MRYPIQTPRRRRWHRWAVVEMNLLTPIDQVVSWHLTRWGAARNAGQLIEHYSAAFAKVAGIFVTDARDFAALPADHHRVAMALPK